MSAEAVWTLIGRCYETAVLVILLCIFAAIAYGHWWDRRERYRRDVETAREIGRRLLCGMDEPDPAWVDQLRREIVAEARKSGYVR